MCRTVSFNFQLPYYRRFEKFFISHLLLLVWREAIENGLSRKNVIPHQTYTRSFLTPLCNALHPFMYNVKVYLTVFQHYVWKSEIVVKLSLQLHFSSILKMSLLKVRRFVVKSLKKSLFRHWYCLRGYFVICVRSSALEVLSSGSNTCKT